MVTTRTMVSVPKGGTVEEERRERRITVRNGSLAGALWFGGWLFTMAFAKLLWWQCIVGVVIWPYYMGMTVR